jgi:hypothetical protein
VFFCLKIFIPTTRTIPDVHHIVVYSKLKVLKVLQVVLIKKTQFLICTKVSEFNIEQNISHEGVS